MRNEKLKRLFSILIICILMFTICLPVYATDTNDARVSETRYTYILRTKTSLTISSTTATCTSQCEGNSSVTTIKATQTLEKHWALGIFNAVNNASWTKKANTSTFTMINTKSGLSSGTYRLRTDFTVTTANGQSETITVYSSEKTIN